MTLESRQFRQEDAMGMIICGGRKQQLGDVEKELGRGGSRTGSWLELMLL